MTFVAFVSALRTLRGLDAKHEGFTIFLEFDEPQGRNVEGSTPK